MMPHPVFFLDLELNEAPAPAAVCPVLSTSAPAAVCPVLSTSAQA